MAFGKGQPYGLQTEAPKRKGMLGKPIRQFNVSEQRFDREDSDGERIALNDDDEIVAVCVDEGKRGLHKLSLNNEACAGFFLCLGLDKDEALERLHILEHRLWFKGPRKVFDAQISYVRSNLPANQKQCHYGVEQRLADRKNTEPQRLESAWSRR